MSTFTPKIDKDDAANELREILNRSIKVHKTIYVQQRRVSQSGMSRKLSLYVVTPDGLTNVTWLAAAVFGEKVHEVDGRNTLNVRGCGIDMHWHTVSSLSRRLYGDERLSHSSL